MDIRHLLKITDMFVRIDWKECFGKDASPKLKEYIKENKKDIFPTIYDGIVYAVENDVKEIALIRFEDSKIFAVLQNKDFIEFLNIIENHFVSTEEYEKCAEVRDFIADIKVKELLKVKPKRKRKSKQTEPELVNIDK